MSFLYWRFNLCICIQKGKYALHITTLCELFYNFVMSKVLLSRDELLQLSAVQCVEEVLCHHMDYGRVLLTADIAGMKEFNYTYIHVHVVTIMSFIRAILCAVCAVCLSVRNSII